MGASSGLSRRQFRWADPGPAIHPTIAHAVAHDLRMRILRGEYPPGTRLKEQQVARQLGVSATPVRDAIRQLAEAGLLELVPNRGAFVKKFTLGDISEMAQLREILEVAAFREAARRITDEDLARLKEYDRVYQDAWAGSDYETGVEADLQFHQYVCEMAGNRRLADMTARLSILAAWLHLLRLRGGMLPLTRVRDDHLLLVDALASRDPDVAEAETRRHIRGTTGELLEWMRAAESALPPAPEGGGCHDLTELPHDGRCAVIQRTEDQTCVTVTVHSVSRSSNCSW
jgi:DNA-binding GntR family transcriptional regulator